VKQSERRQGRAEGCLGPALPQRRGLAEVHPNRLHNIPETLMLSRLVSHIPPIRPSIQWLPSSLGLSRPLVYLRTYSWSSQSQPANWSHLNDIYGKAVDVNPKGPSMSPEERWYMLSRSKTAVSTLPKGPYAGRSFEVKNGNVAEALNKLQYTLWRNRVSSELRLTARHEKKGYKRRRLSSERWRKRFAHEVRKKVQLVNKIRARGA